MKGRRWSRAKGVGLKDVVRIYMINCFFNVSPVILDLQIHLRVTVLFTGLHSGKTSLYNSLMEASPQSLASIYPKSLSCSGGGFVPATRIQSPKILECSVGSSNPNSLPFSCLSTDSTPQKGHHLWTHPRRTLKSSHLMGSPYGLPNLPWDYPGMLCQE